MILADENIDRKIIREIREAGFEVHSIYELMRGTSDESIIDLSRNPPRIILTEDKDFSEWVYAHNVQNISVLFLRYHFKDTDIIIRVILKLLTERANNLFGHSQLLQFIRSVQGLSNKKFNYNYKPFNYSFPTPICLLNGPMNVMPKPCIALKAS